MDDGSKAWGFPSVMFERRQMCVEFRTAGFRKWLHTLTHTHTTHTFTVCESSGWQECEPLKRLSKTREPAVCTARPADPHSPNAQRIFTPIFLAISSCGFVVAQLWALSSWKFSTWSSGSKPQLAVLILLYLYVLFQETAKTTFLKFKHACTWRSHASANFW
jgi:hypothetical protein